MLEDFLWFVEEETKREIENGKVTECDQVSNIISARRPCGVF